MVRAAIVVYLGATGLLAAAPARADTPITPGTQYAIDFYDGVAIGNTAMVGMGGTGAALVVGSAGTLINASAPAVRPTTDTDWWSWDYHFDFLTGKYSTDYDNNGRVPATSDQLTGGASLITGGVSLRIHDWAAAVTATGQTAPLVGSAPAIDADALRVKIVLAKYIPQLDLAIGAGVQSVSFQLTQDGPTGKLFEITGLGALAGATWLPRLQSFRVGAALETAIDGGNIQTNGCDPNDCAGYVLPDHVRSPWRVVAGGAYRFAETEWNQLVGGNFRDEPSLTLAADVVVTGASANAYGVEAFGMHELQRSGSTIAVSLRGGAEYEWLPGRLRVRAGSYWEPERFDGVGGRLHGTFGADVRVFEFELWGRRRGRISVTGDLASRYTNVGASIGFWH